MKGMLVSFLLAAAMRKPATSQEALAFISCIYEFGWTDPVDLLGPLCHEEHAGELLACGSHAEASNVPRGLGLHLLHGRGWLGRLGIVLDR